MKFRIFGLVAVAASAVSCLLGSAQCLAQNAYITNNGSNTVSVIDTASNTVIATITPPFVQSGNYLEDVAVSPDGSKVYFTEYAHNRVGVIDTASNTVIATIPINGIFYGVAVSPDGSKVYVATNNFNTVVVIDTASNTVIATIPVGNNPVAFGVFIPIPVPQTAPVAGNLCNGIYKGTFSGNLTVSAGQDCIFLNGEITGNVSVVGGNFALNNSAVGGNMTMNGDGTYWLGPDATIGGNLKIQNIPSSNAHNAICDTTVNGNVQLDSNGSAVQMGPATTAPLFCAGNAIGGNFEVVDNTNSALMFDNSVGGNMSVLDNTGPVDVVGNTVRGNLLCQNNSDLMMGSGNMVGGNITGQCSGSKIASGQ